MLGVDIDASLIAKARELRESMLTDSQAIPTPARAAAAASSQPAQAAPSQAAPTRDAAPAPAAQLSNDDFRRLFLKPATAAALPASPPPTAGVSTSVQRTRFEPCNFVQEPPAPGQLGVGDCTELFDVVSCFSTSKWVHLNFGDAGLMRLFARAFACLRRGGRFLLEPQPWSSYRKRATLSPTIARHFREIQIRPPQFTELVLSVGFSSAETAEVPYGERTAAGFKRRPLLVFTK